MHRHRLQNIQEWLHRARRKPLVLRGARQVGKSTLVRLFCEAESDRDLLTVNLERHPHLADTFAGNDPATVLNLIEAVSDQSLSERTVLFLDEIQAAPRAFVSLRYFLEEMPALPVVAGRFAPGVHAGGSRVRHAGRAHRVPRPGLYARL